MTEAVSPEATRMPHDRPLKRLRTRRGDYWLASFDLWKERERTEPVAHVLRPESRVCLLGSCFAEQAAFYFARRGYDAWSHPAGELYNPAILSLELRHVLEEVPWPEEIAVNVPGGVVHRFRKRCFARTAEELYELDAAHTNVARESLVRADVIISIVGTTTEVWRSGLTGVVTNEIPHPAVFDPRSWCLDVGELDGVRRDIADIQSILARCAPGRRVFSVCPVPLNATWSASPIIAANGRTKALLRTALDLELESPSIYLDLWDWVQAQTRWGTPIQRDGRHFRESGVDRIMAFAERRLGATGVRLTMRHRAQTSWADVRHLARPLKASLGRR